MNRYMLWGGTIGIPEITVLSILIISYAYIWSEEMQQIVRKNVVPTIYSITELAFDTLKKWLTDFQLTACKSYTGSVAFMKMISAIAVSTVLYNREIFPERYFVVESYEGEKIPMLRSNSNNSKANLIYSWIIGFQDAIEKQYLDCIVLSIYENASKPETFIENYKFSFMYKEENARENVQSSASTVKDATVTFLKACSLPALEFKKLPDKYEFNMKLFYKEGTPEDYEPPGFSACPDSDPSWLVHNYKNVPKYRIGSVAARCHKIRMGTMRPISPPLLQKSDDISDSEMVSKTGAQSTSSGALTVYDDFVPPLIQSIEDLFDEKDLFNLQSANADSTANFARGDKTIENKSFDSKVSAIHEGGDIQLCCPCENKFMGDTIQCRRCKTFQHSICYGLLDYNEPIAHYCDTCASKNPKILCTDLNLFGLDPTSKKELCLFRNALVTCTFVHFTSTNKLASDLKVPIMTAVNIIQKMDSLNIFSSAGIDPTDLMQPRVINHTVLSSAVLSRYFLKHPYVQKESADADDDTEDDSLDTTPNMLSQKEMETDDPSYSTRKYETSNSEPRRSQRIKKPVKRFSAEPVTEIKIKRKRSVIKSNQSNK